MENLKIRDLLVPTDKFPKISDRASFYEALAALETAQEKYLSGKSGQRILLVEDKGGQNHWKTQSHGPAARTGNKL